MCKRSIISLFFFILFSCKSARAQLEADNWVFSPWNPVCFFMGSQPDTLSYPSVVLFLGNGTASYSDKNGKLLFAAGSAGYVFDKNYQYFPSTPLNPSGSGLYGTGVVSLGISQPVLAVPYPGHDSMYIIFHIRLVFNNGLYSSSLYYSVINMNLNNGLGDIVPGQKNIPLLGGAEVGFKLTAVLHCNKKHIWATGHLVESDKYFSFLITENGIAGSPVYFSGNFIPKIRTAGSYTYELVNNNGCLKSSALGSRLAAAFMGMGFVELMDFDTQTGAGSNLKLLNADPPPGDTAYFPWYLDHEGPYGIDFSPSGDKLYVSSSYHMKNANHNNRMSFLYQFDASLPTAAQIQSSKYLVMSKDERNAGAIQIGNNAKMYLNLNDELHEVASPEGAGAACNYTGLKVSSGSSGLNLNVPNFMQSYFRYPVIATGNCQFTSIDFSIQNLTGISSIFWDFGDPPSGPNNTSTLFNPTHIFTSQGSFTVKAILQNANGCGADTIRKVIHAGPFLVYLGLDTTICQGDTLLLKMNIPNAGNLWSNGSRDTIIRVTQPGTYWVRTNIGECIASDTINVTVRSLPVFTLGNDTIICANQPISLSAFPNPSNVAYTWNTGAVSSSIHTGANGLYWLQVRENGYGCKYRDSINIQFKVMPNYSLGPDVSICEKDTITLNATVAGATGYLWNTGATSQTIKAFQTGIYWADVIKDGCTYRDSVDVTVKPLPIVNLGKDTTLCEDVTLQLDAGNSGSQYLWQNNSIGQTFLITNAGNYFVKVTTNGCVSGDSIIIKFDYKPIFSLGNDKVICDGQTITLQPSIQNNTGISFLWSNGSTTPTLAVTQTGTYDLQLTNYCGSKSDEIIVSKGVCQLYVPSGFTPNNDGKNDVFKAYFGENVTSYLIEIYNRWGQKIFRATDINAGWDGKMSGNEQPHDSYVWIIRYKILTDPKEYLLKGTVTLIR